MKVVVQRVINASVTVNGELKGSINRGLLVYLGVAINDETADADWLAGKIAHLRIFDDSEGVMNLALPDIIAHDPDAGVLVVSQFTLLGDVRKGRRPSWGKAAPPEKARELYRYFMEQIRVRGLPCHSGEFQTYMMVNYTNDGPVTILLDSTEM